MHRKYLCLFGLAAFGLLQIGSAHAASCKIPNEKLTPFNLYAINGNKTKMLRSSRNSLKPDARDNARDKKRFAVYIPFSQHRDAGVLLIKQTDYAADGAGSYPKNVRLWRNKRKRLILWGLFSRIDREFSKYGISDTVKYQLFHTIENRLQASGDLFNFHGEYIVNGRNRKTLSRNLKRRLAFAFSDLKFKDKKMLSSLNLAIANVKKAAPEIIGKAIASGADTTIVSTKPIRQLTAKMYYFDGVKKNQGMIFCIPIDFDDQTAKTKIVLIDFDGEKGKPVGRQMKWTIKWVR